MQEEKIKAMREYNKKRIEFDEMIKKSIKFKTNKFDPEEVKKPSLIDQKV